MNTFADDRLLFGCVLCGNAASETGDHAPSRIFLDSPYPDNLRKVGACDECNQKFSLDEQYVACLIDSIICGDIGDPKHGRPKVNQTLTETPALAARLQSQRFSLDGQIYWDVELERIHRVLTKLAKGHIAYEMSEIALVEPDIVNCFPLTALETEQRNAFEQSYERAIFPELGSRLMQRMVAEMELDSYSDWEVVQEGRYRYAVSVGDSKVTVRVVMSEYLGGVVCWSDGLYGD